MYMYMYYREIKYFEHAHIYMAYMEMQQQIWIDHKYDNCYICDIIC